MNMGAFGINDKRLVYHKDRFQHTLLVDSNTIKEIYILRLDGDLYEFYKVYLEYLYPKVVKGGYVIIDDYGSLEGCRRAVHEYLQKHNIKPNIIWVPGGIDVVYWQVK